MAGTSIQLLLEGIDDASAKVKAVNAEVAALGQTAAAANAQAAPLGQALKNTGPAAGKAADGLKGLTTAANTSKQGMQALRSVAVAVGLQTFPRLTAGAMGASSALQAVKGSAALTGLGLGTLSVAAVGVAAVVASGAMGWKAYKAELEASKARVDALNASLDLTAVLLPKIREHQAALGTGRAREMVAGLQSAEQEVRAARLALDRAKLAFASGQSYGMGGAFAAQSSAANLQAVEAAEKRLDAAQRKLESLQGPATEAVLKVQPGDDELKAARDLADLQKRLHVESLAGFEQERAAADLEFDTVSETIAARAKAAGRARNDLEAEKALLTAVGIHAQKLAEISERESQAEQQAIEQTRTALVQRRTAELANLEQVEALRSRIRIDNLSGLEAELAAIDEYYDRELDRLKDLKLGLTEELELREQIEKAREGKKNSARQDGKRDRDEEFERTRGTLGAGFLAIVDSDSKKRSEAEERTRQRRIEAERKMWQDLATIAKAGGQEGLAIWKAMATAIATVDTAKAVIGAFSAMVGIPYIGPALAVAAAAAAAGAGAVQIAAINSATFSKGGYTGPGGKYEPAGVVHRGEVVFSQEDVARHGLAPLLSLRSGKTSVAELRGTSGPFPGYAQGGVVAAPASGQSFNFALIDNRQDRREWEARQGMKVLLGDLQRRGNRLSA